MSGIIGGAGSRSGVIGTTELDYEEGTWTPIDTGAYSATLSSLSGTYTKIGNMAYVKANFHVSSGGSGAEISNFPFTTGSYACTGTRESGRAGNMFAGRMSASTTNCAVSKYDANSAVVTGDTFYLMMIYEVA
jgi:hypothetical protein